MFASVDEDHIKCLIEEKDSKSTQRTIKRSVNLFRSFLTQKNINQEFESFLKDQLNENLRLFFVSIRSKSGDNLKVTSLQSIKYGLSKYLKETCKIDINDPEFSDCKKVFKAKVTDMKKKGYGSIVHKPPITQEDLRKLYNSDSVVFNINTPCGLQMKVWFDVMFYMCRGGRENLRYMTKSTFGVNTDSCGRQFVFQAVDEADKNHSVDGTPDDTIGEGRMYAQPGNVMCPVASFKKYLDKLHLKLDALWQRPLDSYLESNRVWYCRAAIGKNTLGTMMSAISKLGNLSNMYTNHSIRATAVTALDDAGIEARHIMRASGHKSEASIRSYACRLSDPKKREMSDCLSGVLGSRDDQKENENVALEDITMEELDAIFNDSTFSEVPTNQEKSVESPQPLNLLNLNSVPTNVSSMGINVYPSLNNCVVHFNFVPPK
ncbi:uncharacterized protein LOC133178844 [Saccostrea echinata]|uniref:uncharacterized protein LOC133178844 n=1 Tax=Saccostrea echinata TaxID=191078 RepID=UPI002A8180CC|nr:uncharacterized protein LOC133178844 [Saccostrea echinata]